MQSAAGTPEQVDRAGPAFADAGFTELVFDPTVAALDEVDRLADACSDLRPDCDEAYAVTAPAAWEAPGGSRRAGEVTRR